MISDYLRLGKLDDIEDLLKLASAFHHESPYKTMKFDRAKGEKFLRDVLTGKQMDAIVILALDKDETIGFIIGMANEPVFSSVKIATELGWYIKPDKRGTRASALIYAAYEDWARRIGCHYVQGAYLPGVSPTLDKFYKKRGYRQVESSFLKTLKFQELEG